MLRDVSLLAHHFESYDDFVSVHIPREVGLRPLHIGDWTVHFSKTHLKHPAILEANDLTRRITYAEARLRQLTYASPFYVDARMCRGDEVIVCPQVFAGYVPILVGSKYDPESLVEGDLGGYFVVNGKEKCVISQTRAASNVFAVHAHPLRVVMLCLGSASPCSNTLVLSSLERVEFSIKHLSVDIPLCDLWRALGGTLACLPQDAFLDPSRAAMSSVPLAPFGRNLTLDECLDRHVFPHVADKALKRALMLKAVSLLRTASRSRDVTDRDDWGNKRVDATGSLLAKVFSTSWYKACSNLRRHGLRLLEKGKTIDLYKLFPNDAITDGLKYALATGNWKSSRSNTIYQVGVSQNVFRYTPTAVLSMHRRIASSFSREAKVVKPRQLHPSAFGFVCAVETPEGSSIGLINHLALYARVSRLSAVDVKLPLLLDGSPLPSIAVYLNGVPVGRMRDSRPRGAQRLLMDMKACGSLPSSLSCRVDTEGDLWVFTDAGRLLRPLLYHGKRIWVSPDALRTLHIDGTVLQEPHSQALFGTTAATIPFPDHNQSPRNVYQSAMGKQAIGVPMTDFAHRMDSHFHALWHPQKPLVSTRIGRELGSDAFPCGVNVVVAVMAWSGYNQEDSLIFNQSSIDRGLFRSDSYKTTSTKEDICPNKGVYETISRGESRRGKRSYKLDTDGLPPTGTLMTSEDVLIGKICKRVMPGVPDNVVDHSLLAAKATGTVDRVLLADDIHGRRQVSVRTRSTRVPEVGDKFSSRHGQKGTVGQTLTAENMPFTSSGMNPDVIINPHCLPSRMTIGHILETITGKVTALNPKLRRTGDAFQGHDLAQRLMQDLHGCGFERHGNETMYDPVTGKAFLAKIFIGPVYYQRLKHMVRDKIHARAHGPVLAMTRQPTEGRAQGGGLRFGEMEKDCMIAHGASSFLRGRLFEDSDAFSVQVCKSCGVFADSRDENVWGEVTWNCISCTSKQQGTQEVRMPYAAKLLLQELRSMNISAQIVLS